MENCITDMTLRFTSEGNHIARAVDYEANPKIIRDGLPGNTLVNLVMERIFPEFHTFEGWDTDVIAHARVMFSEVDKISKDGFCLLYQDGSITIVGEYDGEVYIRYIGKQAMMSDRLNNIHCIKPGIENWFTAQS